MILIQTGSLWGNLYRLRHYIDGRRVSDAHWRQVYEGHGLTPEQGKTTRKTSGFWRKEWIVR